MSNIIQINTINGTPPFTISVCDQTISFCYLVIGPTGITTPFLFTVPPPLSDVSDIILKIVDSLGCEKIMYLSCGEFYGKEFQDFDVVLFQDDKIYLFEGPP